MINGVYYLRDAMDTMNKLYSKYESEKFEAYLYERSAYTLAFQHPYIVIKVQEGCYVIYEWVKGGLNVFDRGDTIEGGTK